MDTPKMPRENAHMMFDEYNLHHSIFSYNNPVDMVIATNISLYDSDDPETEERAALLAYRFALCISLFGNINLTNQYLESILFSTGTRNPGRVKVRELPPALK